MACRLFRLSTIPKTTTPNSFASITTIYIDVNKCNYHGGRHFKKYYPHGPDGRGSQFPFAHYIPGRQQTPTGAHSPGLSLLDPTRQITQREAPKYQDFERQIEAARRRQILEEGGRKPVQLLEKEADSDTDTDSLTEQVSSVTPFTELETDQFTNPSAMFQEYGYSSSAELEYYSTPQTKVLEFHTSDTVGRPLVETPNPTFVPDEHWVWEDSHEVQQDAHIYEETVLDRMARKGKHYIMHDIFTALILTT
eukprot:UN09946